MFIASYYLRFEKYYHSLIELEIFDNKKMREEGGLSLIYSIKISIVNFNLLLSFLSQKHISVKKKFQDLDPLF